MASKSGKPSKKPSRAAQRPQTSKDMDRSSVFRKEAERWTRKFQTTGSLTHLDNVLKRYKNALEALPPRSARYTDTLVTIGQWCLKRFWKSNDRSSLRESIKHLRDALERLYRNGSAPYKGCAVPIIQAFYALYQGRTDERSRVNARRSYRGAIDALAKLEPRIPVTALNALREACGEPLSFHLSAIGSLLSAGPETPPITHWSQDEDSDSALVSLLGIVGEAYLTRFPNTPSLSERRSLLDHAIGCTDAALIIIAQEKDEVYCRIQEIRGDCLRSRSQLRDDWEDDTDEAILCYKRATESGSLQRSVGAHYHLADTLQKRFLRKGDTTDIDWAVRLDEEAIKSLEIGHPGLLDEHPEYLRACESLATHLLSRFKWEGHLEDANRVVEMRAERAEAHPQDREAQNALAAAVCARFSCYGDISDLNRVVEIDEELLTAAVTVDQQISACHHLGNSLRWRFEQTNSPSDLIRSVEYLQHAYTLAAPPEIDGPSMALRLSLAVTLRYRYQETLNMENLETANHLLSIALDDGAESLDGGLEGLARAKHLLTLLECYQDDSGPWNSRKADRANRISEFILKVFPEGHPFHARGLTARAKCLSFVLSSTLSFPSNVRAENLTTAIALLKEASDHYASPSLDQLSAVCLWCSIAMKWDRASALQAHTENLRLLAFALSQKHSLEGQHQYSKVHPTIRTSRALVTSAAALALNGLNPSASLAVELFERGRGFMFRRLDHLRADVSDVREDEPILARRFSSLSHNLIRLAMHSVSGVNGGGGGANHLENAMGHNDAASSHRKTLAEWTGVVEEIRKIHDFHSFLQPSTFPELLRAADGGPVIIVIIAQDRSNAIILVRDRNCPVVVPLPDAHPDLVESLANRLGDEPHNLLKPFAIGLLRETWNLIVQPVTEKLRDLRIVLGSRIWWCPTGASSRLPLHAAGPYVGNPSSMLDMYVSSYTPSLGALIRARATPSCDAISPIQKMFAMGQPAAAGVPYLPHASTELNNVRQHATNGTFADGTDCTRATVLQGMAEHEWVHVICHATHDRDCPLYSNLFLSDGPLSLLDVLSQDFPDAGLAVLSACSTATVDKDLPDESLHLAAGIMAAGFRSVVATRWELEDKWGSEIMKRFYEEMTREGEKPITSAAKALNTAVTMADTRGVPIVPLMQRINFVHYGI